MFDGIAKILVSAEDVGMAHASLYRWYAKGFTYDRDALSSLTEDLRMYSLSSIAPERLVNRVADFPKMFAWFGPDITGSRGAQRLLDEIATLVSQVGEEDIAPHRFIDNAERYLSDHRVMEMVEELTGLVWSSETLRLVVASDLWDPFYVMPDTLVCFRDDTFATYAVMIAHEGTHILTLDLVNNRDIIGPTPSPLAGLMAEALAQAVQMIVTDQCGIRYDELFPGQGIHDADGYLQAHPMRAQMAPMVLRLVEELQNRQGRSLGSIYREVYEDFGREMPVPGDPPA